MKNALAGVLIVEDAENGRMHSHVVQAQATREENDWVISCKHSGVKPNAHIIFLCSRFHAVFCETLRVQDVTEADGAELICAESELKKDLCDQSFGSQYYDYRAGESTGAVDKNGRGANTWRGVIRGKQENLF